MKKIKMVVLLLTMTLCVSLTSVTAFASGGEETTPPPEVTEATPVEPEPVEPAPLTPDGNLTLVDDLQGDKTQGKQFVTVQSKAGNYFYLIIDRDGDKENVYFLNLVDEADLLALIDKAPVEEVTKPTPTPPVEDKPVEEEKEPTKEKGNSMGLIGLLLIIVLAGGGAVYYFKVLKPKKENTNITYDDLDYEEDEEEFVLEEIGEDDLDDKETGGDDETV